MSLPERVCPGWPGSAVATAVALLFLGRGILAEGGALLPGRSLSDLLLSVLLWIKVAAVAALAGAVAGHLANHAAPTGAQRVPISIGAAWAAVLAAAAAGGVLRGAPESILPFRLWTDTLLCVRVALRTPGQVPWYGGTWFGDDVPLGGIVAPNVYAAWADLGAGVLGVGEPWLLSLSAVPSVLAVLAAAWLAAEVGGRESAVAAAILVALSAWPIVHGRWGYTSVALAPLAVAGTAALVRAGRRASPVWAVSGGVLAGATVHTYPAAWPFLAVLAPALLGAWRAHPSRRVLLSGAGAGVLAMILLVAPAWIGHPDRVGGRAAGVWIGAPVKDTAVPPGEGLAALPVRFAYNVWHYAGLLAGNPDPNPRHFLPEHPPLPAVVGILAIVGAAVLSRGPAQATWIVGALGAGGLLAGVASSPAAVPNTQRVPLFLLAALVLAARAVASLPRTRPGFLAATGLLAAGLVGTEVRLVLGPWANDRRVERAFCAVEVEAGRILARLARDPLVIVNGTVASPFAVETLAAAGRPRPVPTSLRIGVDELAAGRLGAGRAFWILARREDLARVDPRFVDLGRGVSPSPFDPTVVLVRAALRGP
jgi:hypothetical protein